MIVGDAFRSDAVRTIIKVKRYALFPCQLFLPYRTHGVCRRRRDYHKVKRASVFALLFIFGAEFFCRLKQVFSNAVQGAQGVVAVCNGNPGGHGNFKIYACLINIGNIRTGVVGCCIPHSLVEPLTELAGNGHSYIPWDYEH